MRKAVFMLIAVVMLMMTEHALAQTRPAGDMNGDGSIDLDDIIEAIAFQIADYTGYWSLADVNGDQIIGADDIVSALGIVCGSDAPRQIEFVPLIQITQQPQDVHLDYNGSDVYYSVSAVGTDLRYRWYAHDPRDDTFFVFDDSSSGELTFSTYNWRELCVDYLYCRVIDQWGNFVNSTTAALDIDYFYSVDGGTSHIVRNPVIDSQMEIVLNKLSQMDKPAKAFDMDVTLILYGAFNTDQLKVRDIIAFSIEDIGTESRMMITADLPHASLGNEMVWAVVEVHPDLEHYEQIPCVASPNADGSVSFLLTDTAATKVRDSLYSVVLFVTEA